MSFISKSVARAMLCVASLALPLPVFAAPVPAPVHCQMYIRPAGALPVLKDLPAGLFSFKGAPIAFASTAITYCVGTVSTVPTLFGSETWLLLVQTNSMPIGWIFSGNQQMPFQNVNVVK